MNTNKLKEEFDKEFNNDTYQLWKENKKMEAQTTCEKEVWYFIKKALQEERQSIVKVREKVREIRECEVWEYDATKNQALDRVLELLEEL